MGEMTPRTAGDLEAEDNTFDQRVHDARYGNIVRPDLGSPHQNKIAIRQQRHDREIAAFTARMKVIRSRLRSQRAHITDDYRWQLQQELQQWQGEIDRLKEKKLALSS